ncbi:acetyl-CoA carboxylase carboxyltransferase subunit alpha [Streptomyces sp. NPDC052682]|uniref:acetyl-CoA carboxylase carboxyltransferase subunit alpha n=1 Tax=Streptomyces sp. NPDC052682 TaxID=3154954 RepID=UPI00344896FD
MSITTTRPQTGAGPEETSWLRCPGCQALVYRKRLQRALKVCPECRHHLRLSVDERLAQLLDEGSLATFGDELTAGDPLGFTDTKPYPQRLAAARRRTGHNDAAVAGTAAIGGERLVVVALDFGFMGGSVGGVVGELVVRACERALKERLPLLIVSASGGARMQEGALSLMQLAKTAGEVARLHEAGLLVINLNTDPTFGGATASFSMLGDVVLSEPGALIGFAGPQVIRQTIRQELPAGFQTAEFLHERGILDLVVPRENLRGTLAKLLRLHGRRPAQAPEPPASYGGPLGAGPWVTDPDALPVRDARAVVDLARDTGRPTALDYLSHAFDEFLELHGDGATGEDPAIVGGIARIGGRPVVFAGHQKGHDTAELVRRNFGMPNPEGYRKVLRLMGYAEKFSLPFVTLVDTPGAYPGIAAEERGQGSAIARCIMRMSRLRVPTVTLVTGEGGSGGALALGVGNAVLMLENAYYSVISPEGCSTILFGSAAEAPRAAAALRLTAPDLLRTGVLDAVVPEPEGGAHTDPLRTADAVRDALVTVLDRLSHLTPQQLVEHRHARFRRFGTPAEPSSTLPGESR